MVEDRKIITSEEFQDFLFDSSVEEIRGRKFLELRVNGNFRKENSIAGNKRIVDCVFEGNSEINTCDIAEASIQLSFINCTFNGLKDDDKLVFFNVIGGFISFDSKCEFNIAVNITRCQTNRFWFNGVFNNEVTIGLCKINDVRFQGSNEKNIILNDVSIYNYFEEDTGAIQNFSIREAEVKGHLTFNKLAPNSIFIGDGIYNKINFYNCKDVNSLKILGSNKGREHLIINDLRLINLSLEGDILVKFAEITNITINPFIGNSGLMRFHAVTFLGNVIFKDSELDGVRLNDVSFAKAKAVFDMSNLQGFILSNIDWGEGYKLYSEKELGNSELSGNDLIESHKTKKEVYRQLKQISKNQGNIIDSMAFYRNEMTSYWYGVKKSKSINRSDRWLIRINKWVSDFGQNWSRPILLIFILNSICFTILILLNYKGLYFTFDPSKMSRAAFQEGFGEFFRLINPVRKIPTEMSGFMIGVDLFYRVVAGFFIYHLIKASRRFGIR